MDYDEILALIDERLEREERLAGIDVAADADGHVWTLDGQSARTNRSGTTGIALSLAADDRVMHERIFARSPLIVDRIVRVIVEHLTKYVVH